MAGAFQANAFQNNAFQTEVVVALNGGTKQRRSTGRRDLDKLEQARERERLAHLEAVRKHAEAKAKESEAAKPQPITAEAVRQSIAALGNPQTEQENELSRQALRLAAQETARAAADAALVQAIAVQRQLDDEAAHAFLAYLMAA